MTSPRRSRSRCLAFAAAVALSSSIDARADVPVTVVPHGVSFRLSPAIGETTCSTGSCLFHVAPGDYRFVAPGLEEPVSIEGPTTLEVRRGWGPGRTVGGVMALGGALVTGATAYAALKVCATSSSVAPTGATIYDRPCDDGPYASRNRHIEYALLGVSGVAFATTVVGAILFFTSGPSLHVDAADRPSTAPVQWGLAPMPSGGLAVSAVGVF